MSLTEKVQSLRSFANVEYVKPDPARVDEMIKALGNNKEAQEYLESRGLNEKTIKYFNLGYDSGKNAIAIPNYKRGELINIKYRYLKPVNAKYIQETGAEVWIFNETGITKGVDKGGVLIVEGEFDCMMAHQNGFENVVSPSGGKDSYGIWLELLDNIKKIYIAYDNDEAGRGAAQTMAERLGEERCKEVLYPQGIKDANEYFRENGAEDFRELLKSARPFYSHKFTGVTDILENLRTGKKEKIKTKFIPKVKMGEDWLVVISGERNVGKTSYVMNVIDDFLSQDMPCLILPFERGPNVVGERFLQVHFDMAEEDFMHLEGSDWDDMKKDTLTLPLYFAMPSKEELEEVIVKSKRIFNTKVVVIDHLDYLIRGNDANAEMAKTLQMLKSIAIDHQILILGVTHIRKQTNVGSSSSKKPSLDDLKGSSSLSQDPECVIMLLGERGVPEIEVDVQKNKGEMDSKVYDFKLSTGRISESKTEKLWEEI